MDGDLQLLVEPRFAPPEPGYYRARQASYRPRAKQRLAEPPSAVFDRLARSFGRALPLSGLPDAAVSPGALERWLPGGGTVRVDDAARAAEMARRLEQEWRRFVPDELAPDDEAFEREPPGRRRRPRKAEREPGGEAQ